ncbi:hypothetical protein Salat_1754200 [Sesamum alatum]|uniref:Uncharacterized protein n=1 Tax=Sesamum alatum TaxID=300844 RepID=A0AAE1Y8T8_9LAMI|nr:hypothetical protein Salat_1754200 [Sesamum alatum]
MESVELSNSSATSTMSRARTVSEFEESFSELQLKRLNLKFQSINAYGAYTYGYQAELSSSKNESSWARSLARTLGLSLPWLPELPQLSIRAVKPERMFIIMHSGSSSTSKILASLRRS